MGGRGGGGMGRRGRGGIRRPPLSGFSGSAPALICLTTKCAPHFRRKGMKAFCRDASINARHHGEFWKKMSPLLPNSSGGKKSNGIVLIENEAIVTEPIRVAETFNNYFVEVAGSSGDDKTIEEFDNHPSTKAITERVTLNQFTFQTVNVEYVRKILNNLEPKKSVGVDDKSPRLLKLSAPAIANAVTELINY